MNQHLDFCRNHTPDDFRENVAQEKCLICQAWAAGYRVGYHGSAGVPA